MPSPQSATCKKESISGRSSSSSENMKTSPCSRTAVGASRTPWLWPCCASCDDYPSVSRPALAAAKEVPTGEGSRRDLRFHGLNRYRCSVVHRIGAPDHPITRDPFGTATISVDYGQLAAIWRDERAQLVADAEAVAACLADGVPDCAAGATLVDIVTEAKRYQGKALIAHINRAINLLIRPTPGGWRA